MGDIMKELAQTINDLEGQIVAVKTDFPPFITGIVHQGKVYRASIEPNNPHLPEEGYKIVLQEWDVEAIADIRLPLRFHDSPPTALDLAVRNALASDSSNAQLTLNIEIVPCTKPEKPVMKAPTEAELYFEEKGFLKQVS